MEPQKKSSKLLPGILLALAAVALVVYASSKKDDTTITESTEVINKEENSTDNISQETSMLAYTYRDGTYSATGSYTSPGGPESIDVTLTIKEDVVTAATVKSNATLPTSVGFQGKFISGYKQYVVGKKVDEINLSAVSGSSLTPKGFTDALAKIKAQAKV